jgi:site-specific DNA-methyltransferase (adenine-specific)
MAGFEIRDSIGWVYGSGFPKSLDVAKAIQKASGVEPTGYKENKDGRFYGGGDWNETPRQLFMPEPEGEAKQWQGWGTALKPALEPIVVARKPLIGTVAENVLTHGTGGLNIDASRIGTEQRINPPTSANANRVAMGEYWDPEAQPTTVQGRWPANLILSHTESCQSTGKTIKSKTGAGKRTATFGTQDTQSGGDGSGGWSGYEYETEVYECVEGCPVKTLDEQSGQSKSPKTYVRGVGTLEGERVAYANIGEVAGTESQNYGDSGGASRFFYVAKASKRDRNEGLEELLETSAADMVEREPDSAGMNSPRAGAGRTSGAKNFHPTVKPTALMQYLVKLITPPGGTVLDPFTGSGSTGKAAILEGFDFIGIELTEDYWPIIEGRLKHAEAKVAEAKENQEAQPQGLF